MAIFKQIENFTAFAKRLAEEQGDSITLDEAYERWRQIDQDEIRILRERLASYDAGEQGIPANEAITALRAQINQKHG